MDLQRFATSLKFSFSSGEMVFTTEKPEDGGEIPVAVGADGEGNEPPSADEEVSLDKLMSE